MFRLFSRTSSLLDSVATVPSGYDGYAMTEQYSGNIARQVPMRLPSSEPWADRSVDICPPVNSILRSVNRPRRSGEGKDS